MSLEQWKLNAQVLPNFWNIHYDSKQNHRFYCNALMKGNREHSKYLKFYLDPEFCTKGKEDAINDKKTF